MSLLYLYIPSARLSEYEIDLHHQLFSEVLTYQKYSIMTVTATFTPELHGWVNTTTDVNFTHGFDVNASGTIYQDRSRSG